MQQSSRLLSLPLAKYSRANDVVKDGDAFAWSHVLHDLTVAFDTLRGADSGGSPSQMLRVIHGGQVLVRVHSMDATIPRDEAVSNPQTPGIHPHPGDDCPGRGRRQDHVAAQSPSQERSTSNLSHHSSTAVRSPLQSFW